MEDEAEQDRLRASVISACSGADAQQADKASAVSPRSSDGLLPCPFCGGEAKVHKLRGKQIFDVYHNCTVSVRLFFRCKTEREAIGAGLILKRRNASHSVNSQASMNN